MQKGHSTGYQPLARWLVARYPASWRKRYAEEMLMILEDAPPTLKTILNLLLHLCDAYLHQDLVQGRTPYMLEKTRLNALVIYGATLIFFIPWLFVRSHFMEASSDGIRVFPAVSLADPLPTTITRSVTYLLLILILFGGAPILVAAIFRALKERKWLSLLLCLLGLVSPLIAVIIVFELTRVWFFLPFGIVVGLGVSMALITFSVKRAPNRFVTSYALSLATIIPLVMLVGLATVLFRAIPTLFALLMAGGSLFYILREDLLILLMAAAFVLILVSLKKGFEAKRATAELLTQSMRQSGL